MALPPRTVILGSPASPTHKVDPIELADLLDEMQLEASSALEAVVEAEAARDAAFANADIYADIATGRAAVADGEQFMVLDGDEIVRYRRDTSTTQTEMARYPTVANVVSSRPIIDPIQSEATLLRDLGNPSISGARAVIAATDTDLNRMGYFYENSLTILAGRQDSYFVIPVPADERSWGFGDYLAVSVIIRTDDWSGLNISRLRAFTFNRTGSFQQAYNFSDYDEIRSDLRRYHGAIKLTNVNVTDISGIWIEVTADAGRSAAVYATGAMAGLSESFAGGLNWRDAPFKILETEAAETIGSRGAILKTMVPNGQMLNGGTTGVVAGLSTVTAITDTELNNLGITHALAHTNLAAIQDSYGRLIADQRHYGAGDWFAYSFFVKTADFSGINTSRLRALCLPQSGGGVQTNLAIDPTAYKEWRADLRQYFGAIQIPTTANITDINQVWIEVTSSAGRSAAIYVAGHAAALSRLRPIGVDGTDFDPYSEADHEARLTALDGGAVQAVPGLLIPSSFHLVEGRPLQVYGHGLTEFDRDNRFDVGFQGVSASGRPFSGNVAEFIELDGDRLSGAGYVYSRPYDATNPVYRRPVNFYTVAATGLTGSPNVLMIGDSITYEGVVTKTKARMEAMGMTPNFIGTFNDNLGTPSEARSSWEFSDFTRRHTFLDVAAPLGPGVSPTYPIDGVGGDGVIETVVDYLALSSAARFRYNPFIRPSTGGDDPSLIENGYVFDLDFYLTRFSFPTPHIVTIALGTNDFNSNDDATSLQNVTDGLAIMVGQIQAAAPSAAIGIVMKGKSAEAIAGIRHVLETYGDREDEGIYVLILDHFVDWSIYGASRNITVNSTDAYGVQNITVGDRTHPDEIGKAQQAEFLAAFIAGRF